MKKFLFPLILAGLCAATFVGCSSDTGDTGDNQEPSDIVEPGDNNNNQENPPEIVNPVEKPAENVSLNETALTLRVGESATLVATVTPSDTTDTLRWVSGNPEVATVNGGTVTAVKAGSAEITATAGTVSAKCVVTVEEVPSDEVKKDGYFWYEDFETLSQRPNYLNYNSTGSGSVSLITDAQTEKACLKIETSNTGSAFADYTFESPSLFAGTVIAEARVKVDTEAFSNILFLYTSDASPVLTLAMEAGYFRNHSGGTWNNTNVAYEYGKWYDIKLFIDFEKGTYNFVLDGELVYENLPFRNFSLADSVSYLRAGSDKANSSINFDYFKFSYADGPSLTVNTASEEIDLTAEDANGELVLDYECSSDYEGLEISVTCDKSGGFVWQEENKKLKFTASGTYTFTIEATDVTGKIVSDTITVSVNGSLEEPSVTINSEENAAVSLQTDGGAKYVLDYTLGGSPVPDVEISCSMDGTTVYDEETENGCMIYDSATNTAIFYASGVYTFTVKATNSEGTVQKQITVTVTDKYATPSDIEGKMIYGEDFGGSVKPEDITEKTSGSGSINYNEQSLTVMTGTSSGSAFYDKSFDSELSGVVGVEMKFRYEHETDTSSFVNLMFLTNTGSTTNVTNFAVEYGYLKYHNGSSWKIAQFGGYDLGLVKGAWYNLRVVNDFENKVSYLYLSGESINLYTDGGLVAPMQLAHEIYLGSYAFRNPNTSAYVFRTGSDKASVNYSVDYVKIWQYGPILSLNGTEKTIEDFNGESVVYTLGSSDSEVNVTCDKSEGVAINGLEVTFTSTGTYLFTVTARNEFCSVEKTVTVIVSEKPLPEFTESLSVENSSLVLVGESVSTTLRYEAVNGNVSVSCERGGENVTSDVLNGKTLTFSEIGVYTVIVTVGEGDNSVSESVTVTVLAAYETISSVDFTDADTRPAAPEGTGSATAEYTEYGLNFNTTAGSGSLYYDTLFNETLTGILTAEIDFSLESNHNQFINLLFVNNDANSPASCYGVSASGNIQHSPKAGSWISQTYNGSVLALQKCTSEKRYVYSIKVVFDLDNKISYLYLSGDAVLLDGAEYELPEGGIFIASNAFRGTNVSATRLRCGIDSKSGVNFTVSGLNVYKSNIPVFITEPDGVINLTLSEGSASTQLSYTLINGTTEVTCENEGVSVEGNTLNFSRAGEYTVTVTATNSTCSIQKTLTVNVADETL